MRVKDNLDKQFGIEPIEAEYTEVKQLPVARKSTALSVADTVTVPQVLNTHTEEDVNLARETIVDVLSRTSELLDDAINIARESQDSKAIDSTTALMTAIVKMSKELVNLHTIGKTKTKVEEAQDKPAVQENTQNNIFVGTTDELQDMVEAMRKKKK